MDIYSQNKTPYFYIIEHKATGIKYAGAKWAKDANPDNFMTESGYKTSSNTIKNIIATEGLDIFKINEIILLQELNSVPFGCQTIDEYESWFLKTNSCRISKDWYNRVVDASFGTIEFKNNMMAKYGVEYASQISSTIPKIIKTNNEKYGVDWYAQTYKFVQDVVKTNNLKYNVDWYTQTNEYKYRSESTCIEKYGRPTYLGSDKNKLDILNYLQQFGNYTNCSQLEFVKQKKIDTCLINFGVNFPAQSPIIKEKIKNTCLIKYGETSYTKTAECKEKTKITLFNRYGDINYCNKEKIEKTFMEKYNAKSPLCDPIIKQKSINTLKANYGDKYNNPFEIPEIMDIARIKGNNTILKKYGVKNVSYLEFYCQDCDKHSKGLGNIKRNHKGCENIFLKIHNKLEKYNAN